MTVQRERGAESAVAFDLDMTLVDTRPGIRAALLAFAEETGRPIDADAIVSALGPPVAQALSPWFAAAELPAAVARFREHMAAVGVMNVAALPGAAELTDAVRQAGFRVVVVTSKIEPLARATLMHAGLAADMVYGDVWAERKAVPLAASGAVAFVGDHPADMLAARAAHVFGYGVTTGSSSADELSAAGASCVVPGLHDLVGRFTAGT